MKKHLFFDMDGTLTPSRSPMSDDMHAALIQLADTHDLIIVSGSHNDQMKIQIPNLPIIQLGQNGNHCIHPEQGELWNDVMNDEARAEVLAHAAQLRTLIDWDVPDEDDLLEDRGSQISFSLYGHYADAAIKRTIDPDFSKRRSMMEQAPFISDTAEAKIAGSTSIDYFKKGRNKGYNIDRLCTELHWSKDDCVYYGDALFPGGNDETVVGVIETIEVKDPDYTLQKLQERL